MALQKFTVYVCASTEVWDFGSVSVLSYDPTPHPSFHQALISTHEIELDVPEFDVCDQAISVLEKEIQKERADSEVRVGAMLERISKLQAIGHEVAE